MKYSNLESYIDENKLTIREFARRCEMRPSTMCRILHGKTDIQKKNIDKILKETGMCYEKCFKEEE